MMFKAIRSVQAGNFVYLFFVSFENTEKIFSKDNEIQRKLMPGRVTKFKNYLKNDPDFVFPPVVASVDTDSKIFENGILKINKKLTIHDGQHRIAGVVSYVDEYNYLRLKPRKNKGVLEKMDITEVFPVTLYHVFSQDRAKKIFFDINKNSIKPSKKILDSFNPL